MPTLTIGKVILGGAGSALVIWLLMQYDSKAAWLYLVLILLGVMAVYHKVIFTEINTITSLLNK